MPEPCIACPVEVRGLYASASNAVRAVASARDGAGSWERAFRKLAELGEAVTLMAPIVEAHFSDHGPRIANPIRLSPNGSAP